VHGPLGGKYFHVSNPGCVLLNVSRPAVVWMSAPHYTHDNEREPLTRAPTYASQSSDITDEPPPTYGEAIHSHDGPVLAGSRIPPTIEEEGHSYVVRPLEEMTPEEPPQNRPTNTVQGGFSKPVTLKGNNLLGSLGGCMLLGFIVAGIGGTFRFVEMIVMLISVEYTT
jgi:hypothetical protein